MLYDSIIIAYPLVVCSVLFFSQLHEFTRHSTEHNDQLPEKKRVRPYTFVWWIQALITCVTLGTVILTTVYFLRDIGRGVGGSYQSTLISNITLFLFFAAGLLPDPDEGFEPTISHIYAWIVAITFEIVSLLLAGQETTIASQKLGSLLISTSAVRAFLLCINASIIAFVLRTGLVVEQDKSVYVHITAEESDVSYGTANGYSNKTSKHRPAGDAQSTGWFNYFVGFRALFPYFWPSDSWIQQAVMVLCFGLLVAQRAINILVPHQLGTLIAALGVGQMPCKELVLYCVYRALQGQQGIIGSIRAILWIPVSQSLFSRLTYAAYEHVMLLSLDFHLSKKTGEVISALSKGGALNTFLDGFAFQLFPMVFDLGIAAVYLYIRFNAFYSIITVGVLWSYVFATIYMAKYRGRARRVMTARDREMEATKTDTIMAYDTVHYNNALPIELSRFATAVSFFQKAEFTVLFSLNSLNALQNLIFIFGIVLVAMLSAYEISQGTAATASFVTLITYFTQLQAPLAFFGSFYNQVQNNLVDAERMLDLFNREPNIQDSPNAKSFDSYEGLLEFRNVNFAYDVRKKALSNVSFTVQPGTTTAVVGESGSGKSTCLKLIFRFYDVDSGSVHLDGHDVRNLKIDNFRRSIAVVPQDTILFNDTLWHNLKYSKPSATDQEVFNACRAASIHSKILGFPDGYNTIVGERGLKLSGGEKQRVSIARAILKAPSLMLLDEATASLDSQTERLIQGALRTATRGRTTVIIAHRLSTVIHADQIIVMHAGCVDEVGTHAQLLVKGGRYAEMWQKQTADEDTVS